jgi:hypothetical protein
VAEESVALYQSNGLLFEWYQGAQPYRHHRSVPERQRPMDGYAPPDGSGQSCSGIPE